MNFFLLFQLKKLVAEDDVPNPRVTWGAFLTSVCHEVPSERFREWQDATFRLAMSMVPPIPIQPAIPVPPPRSQTQMGPPAADPALPN